VLDTEAQVLDTEARVLDTEAQVLDTEALVFSTEELVSVHDVRRRHRKGRRCIREGLAVIRAR